MHKRERVAERMTKGLLQLQLNDIGLEHHVLPWPLMGLKFTYFTPQWATHV